MITKLWTRIKNVFKRKEREPDWSKLPFPTEKVTLPDGTEGMRVSPRNELEAMLFLMALKASGVDISEVSAYNPKTGERQPLSAKKGNGPITKKEDNVLFPSAFGGKNDKGTLH